MRTAPKNGEDVKGQKIGDVKRDRNPLVTDLDYRDKDTKRMSKAQLWFEKDAFKDIQKTDEKDEDMDLDRLVYNYRKKGVEVAGEEKKPEEKKDLSGLGKKAKRRAKYDKEEKDSSDESDSDNENQPPHPEGTENGDTETAGPKMKKVKLNEEELALGQLLITSKKTRRDLTDGAWNRYMFNDQDLPDWFVEDEKKNMCQEAPVPKDLVESYRKNVHEFNTRSIKKVMEAKARKKRQSKKRMEKIKKKAELIMENVDNTNQEKIKMLKK